MIISEQSAVKAFTLIMLDWQSIKKRNKLKKLTRVFPTFVNIFKATSELLIAPSYAASEREVRQQGLATA